MLQEIITYMILAGTFGILILNILRFFKLAGKKTAISGKCAGCSGGCEIKELNQFRQPKILKPEHYRLKL